MEKQKLFDGSEVPTKALPSDVVLRSDDSKGTIRDSFADCRGGFHASEEDRHVMDVTIVEEVLNQEDEWATEYCQSEDYGEGYRCCLGEDCYNWFGIVKEWIEENYQDAEGYQRFDDTSGFLDSVVKYVVSSLANNLDVELEYNSNEYDCYSGPGCCLDSYDIGEHENEVNFDRCPELKELHDSGVLDDVLDDVNCDAYVYRHRRRELNEETGNYEHVGRETYACYGDTHHITTYHCPGGRWHFVVPTDSMRELVTEAIIRICRG